MSEIHCLYSPKDDNKRPSCRVNKSGDGRNNADDCMVRSKTNRCILNDKHRKSKRVTKKSIRVGAIRDKSQATKLHNQAVKLARDEEWSNAIAAIESMIEQTRLKLRKAFGVRKNESDTPAIRSQLQTLREKEQLKIYREFHHLS